MFLDKFNFRLKIIFIPIFVTILLIFAWNFFFISLQKSDRILGNTLNGFVPAYQTNREMLGLLERLQSTLEDAVSQEDRSLVLVADKFYDQLGELINFELNNPVIVKEVTSKEKLLILESAVEDYYQVAREATIRVIEGEIGEKVIFALERMSGKYNKVENSLNEQSITSEKIMEDNLEESQKNTDQSILWITITIIIIIAFAFIFSSWIVNNITKPLNVIINLADKLANGDLSVEVPYSNARDESGILMHTFKKMVQSLASMTTQIKDAANALAASSSEISASVTQIASGATETATAANETSTTVEEVRQTALDSNRKAKYVSESAQKAVQVSQAGEKAVGTMVDGMRQIESQMESIAESIMKLSEHGQAIGGIIATVEDVAEQSNLLAVNASIEAAKAGEQGKGFAVVAHEVKNLAEQSRQATARVRNILDDIQKATSGAVMTTEQGTKAVESGVEKSFDASDSIQRLANSVSDAAQATTQIAVSSQEQLVGMDQVVSAMESIKQASTQNVSATKQVESAAHDLHELGQRLKVLIEQYIV